jgi:signal transduction histidine kinase
MRERVELLGGTLWIESTPGQGTTVAVTLPVARLELNGAPAPELREVGS